MWEPLSISDVLPYQIHACITCVSFKIKLHFCVFTYSSCETCEWWHILHSVEIWEFSYHFDFTWNHFLQIWLAKFVFWHFQSNSWQLISRKITKSGRKNLNFPHCATSTTTLSLLHKLSKCIVNILSWIHFGYFTNWHKFLVVFPSKEWYMPTYKSSIPFILWFKSFYWFLQMGAYLEIVLPLFWCYPINCIPTVWISRNFSVNWTKLRRMILRFGQV